MKISDVSNLTGLSTHTLRYYEKIGLVTTSKDQSGHRNYTAGDIELLNWIACLKNSGMPLNRIKSYANSHRIDDYSGQLDILEQHLRKLQEQQRDIDHYLSVTQSKISSFKKRC